MTYLRMHGDTHGSEEAARSIHKSISSQGPEAVFYELDLKGEKLKYYEKALTDCVTVEDFFGKIGNSIPSQLDPQAPLYELKDSTIAKLKKDVIDDIDEDNIESLIVDPHSQINNPGFKHALFALLHQYNVRADDTSNTLLSRVFHYCAKEEASFHRIDIDRNEMPVHGAEKYRALPSEPKAVNFLMAKAKNNAHRFVNDNDYPGNQEMLNAINSLIDEFDEEREGTMAAQIEDRTVENNYSNVSAIVGSSHMEKILRLIKENTDFELSYYET